jgi:hypothetical protein
MNACPDLNSRAKVALYDFRLNGAVGDADQWRKTSMSKLRQRAASSTPAVLLALSILTSAAIPTEAWARPGGSHHESNQGEVYKHSFWTMVVKAIKVHIVRPVTEVVSGGNSSTVCH